MRDFKKIVSLLLVLVMSVGMVFTLASCKDDVAESKWDTERDPVRFAIEGQDGVFNPFFSTTAYDSEITGQTQIGLLTTKVIFDSDGKYKGVEVAAGDDYASVAKDFTERTFEEDGKKYTEYSFLIKNGVKFSDGEDLTIKDVLFNLYLYLDPVYTGNATIYSTDIVGLMEYRTQGESTSEDDFNRGFVDKAEIRINAIYDYCQYFIHESSGTGSAGSKPADGTDALRQILSDIDLVKSLFREELTSDYQTAISSLEDYQKEYTIENPWQLFLYLEGIAQVETSSQTGYQIKENGKYKIDFSAYESFVSDYVNENWRRIQSESSGMSDADAKAKAEQEFVTKLVWERYIESEGGDLNYSGMQGVVLGSASAEKVLERFTAEAKSDYFEEKKNSDGGLTYSEISGITTERVTSFNGNALDGTYDVLKIKINDVDPKAIWNFAFTVAPMHYYSNAETIKNTKFGVEYASTDFMNNVVKDSAKLGVPVGAGPYKASKQGGLPDGEKYPTKNQFLQNNVVYYERNTYFETLGPGINNAKIKYIRYQVINSAQTIATLGTDGIDVGSPSGTQENLNSIAQYPHLATMEVKTNGYGYVGINPKYVPDIAVRRAIMYAMDTSLILNYYPEGSCERIFWPMSKTSWAYPDDGRSYPYYQLKTAEEILNYLLDAGYEQRADESGSKLLGKTDDSGVWKQLTYTFTIPGTTSDHPSMSMFQIAAQTLNSIGFKISVKTDNWALKKLATGELAIWAAAWSSTVDPDMYQVYHVDSKASSTLNWGYDVIKSNQNNRFDYEYGKIYELSELIDAARAITDQDERTTIYADALEIVMQLAVEMPTYQRTDLTVYNSSKIDRNSLTPDNEIGPNNGLFAKIWEMDFVK